jgi:translocation and assembly module TamA
MRRRALLPAALSALASACLTAHGTAERPLVRAFEIQGTHAVSQSDIKEHLGTQASSHFLFFRQEPHYYDPDALAVDLKRIERYYQSQGYYRARVTGAEVRPSGEGRVNIVVRVEEGEPVRVQDVSVVGLEAAPEVKIPRLPIRRGQVFTEARFDAGRRTLVTALHSSGYARAEVAQHADIDYARTSARVTYTLEPGERYRFGNIFVAGTVAVPRARVREEAQSLIEPGATFDETLLPRAQTRVFDLGVFGGVRVTQGTPDPEAGSIPVVVAVREAPFHTIRAGPGIGFDAYRWEAHVVAGWQDRNWLGGLRKLSIDGRIGYAWIPTPFTSEGRVEGWVGSVSGDFTQPGVIARPISLNLRLGVERGLEQVYSFWAERFRVGLPTRLSHALTLVPSYNLEVYQLQGNPALPPAGAPTTSQLFLAGCPTDRCVLSYFEQTVAWDGRDNPIETHSGAYLGLSLQEGFKIAGNGFEYLRLLPEARGFVPLGRRTVLAARLRLGLLMPLGGEISPIVARFISGGANSMRGYYTGRFSPMQLFNVGTTDNPVNAYLPVGGNGLLEGSIELRYPLSNAVEAVTFVDIGSVGVVAHDVFDFSQLQAALGFGLRYRTPFGPVRVDLAAHLPKLEGGQWVLPHLPVVNSPPGAPTVHSEPIFAFHFSLGEAF